MVMVFRADPTVYYIRNLYACWLTRATPTNNTWGIYDFQFSMLTFWNETVRISMRANIGVPTRKNGLEKLLGSSAWMQSVTLAQDKCLPHGKFKSDLQEYASLLPKFKDLWGVGALSLVTAYRNEAGMLLSAWNCFTFLKMFSYLGRSHDTQRVACLKTGCFLRF